MEKIKRMKKQIFKILLVMFCILGVSMSSFAKITDKILIIVNDEVITKREVDRKLSPIFQQLRMQYDDDVLQYQLDKVKDQVLQQTISDKLIVSEAKRLGVVVEPAEIEEQIKIIRKQFPSSEEFYMALEEQGIRLVELRRNYTESLMAKKLIDSKIGSQISILPFEIKEYYKEHKDKFMEPEKAQVQQILIRVNDDRDDKMAYNIISGILYRLRKGENFQQMAVNCSEDSTASSGGDMGTINKGHLAKKLEDVIFSLNEGDISDPINSPIGYHVFKVVAKEQPKLRSFYDVHDEIEGRIYKQKITKKMGRFLEKLKENAYIDYKM